MLILVFCYIGRWPLSLIEHHILLCISVYLDNFLVLYSWRPYIIFPKACVGLGYCRCQRVCVYMCLSVRVRVRQPPSIYVLTGIFSVEVCLEGVFPHSVSTRQDPCVKVYAPPTLVPPREKTISNWGDPALHLHQARGASELTHGFACIIGWWYGLLDSLIFTYIAQSMGYVINMIHYGLKVVFYFRHFTVFHYHHYARLIAGTEHI